MPTAGFGFFILGGGRLASREDDGSKKYFKNSFFPET
jgi:hypothetical protein